MEPKIYKYEIGLGGTILMPKDAVILTECEKKIFGNCSANGWGVNLACL